MCTYIHIYICGTRVPRSVLVSKTLFKRYVKDLFTVCTRSNDQTDVERKNGFSVKFKALLRLTPTYEHFDVSALKPHHPPTFRNALLDEKEKKRGNRGTRSTRVPNCIITAINMYLYKLEALGLRFRFRVASSISL